MGINKNIFGNFHLNFNAKNEFEKLKNIFDKHCIILRDDVSVEQNGFVRSPHV